uniref:Extended synaptotagmin 3 n=1 Tax=Salvator merianae TaxID=96440 RepID=A0A8D0C6G4_SALMN
MQATAPERGQPVADPGKEGSSRGSLGEPKSLSPLIRELGTFVARALLCLAPVYLAGYVGLSTSWMLIGLLLWMWWRRNRREKRSRLLAAFGLVEDEKEAISQGIALQQLPAWVHFPDVERVEWLNKILEQTWPYFGAIMEKTFKEVLEPKIRAKNVHLKTCTFTKIQLGDKVRTVEVKLSKFKVGVNGVQLYGTLRVILEPLLTDVPFFGAVTIFFIQKPHLEINWAGLTNLLDAPGISFLSDSLIQDLIAARLVLPNRVTIPLKKNMNIANLRFPVPRGVVRVYLLEAENLVQKDNFLGAIRGKSDPYALLRVGLVQSRSKTVQRDLNPIWNEMFEFVVHEIPGQDLEVDLYDEDPDEDDFLGSKIASGHVHLKLEWFSLVVNQEKLSGVRYCILSVRYRRQVFQTHNKCFIFFSSSQQTCNFTKDPVWGQAFTFFVHSAASQSLHLEIKDKERENALGTSVLSLAHLLKNSEMTLEQNFPLDHSGTDSCIKLKVMLRALAIEPPDPESVYTGIHALKQVPIPATEQDENQGKTLLVPPPPPPPPPSLPPLPKVEVSRAPQENKNLSMPECGRDLQADNPNLNVNGTRAGPVVPEAVAEINEDAGTGGLHSQSSTPPKTLPITPRLPALKRLQLAPSAGSLRSLSVSNFDITLAMIYLSSIPSCLMYFLQFFICKNKHFLSINHTFYSKRNLTPCSQQGAHPYVRIYLLPDKRWVTRRRTTVKKRTLNPQYDEKFEFFDTLEDIKRRTLDVAVKNRRPFISHERKELGKVLIDLSKEDLVKGFSQWYQLTINGQPQS